MVTSFLNASRASTRQYVKSVSTDTLLTPILSSAMPAHCWAVSHVTHLPTVLNVSLDFTLLHSTTSHFVNTVASQWKDVPFVTQKTFV